MLSRKRLESLQIGDDVTVTVVEIRDHRVVLGVTAPKDVTVHRTEVAERIKNKTIKPKIPPTAFKDKH